MTRRARRPPPFPFHRKVLLGATPSPRGDAARRTARDVLNELRWRQGESLEDAVLHVRDRAMPGRLRAVPGKDIAALGRRTFDTATATIPFYKVVRIEYRGRVLFERAD